MKFFSFAKFFREMWRRKRSRRPAKAAPWRRVRLRLEELEDRTAPSVTNVLPAPNVSDPTQIGNGFDAQVATDPLNHLKMVEVHTTGGALAGNYSLNGGVTWQALALPANLLDPSTVAPEVAFTVVLSPSITFDRSEQFYVVSVQENNLTAVTLNLVATEVPTSGAVVLDKFDFTGNIPQVVNLAPNLATALAAPLAGSVLATTLTVTSNPVNLPSTPFDAFIDSGKLNSEEIQVTKVTGTTWTVVRGINGTFVSGHAAGAPIAILAGDDLTPALPGLVVPGPGEVLYRWEANPLHPEDGDPAYNPYVAVDANVPSFTDPTTNQTQTDTMAAPSSINDVLDGAGNTVNQLTTLNGAISASASTLTVSSIPPGIPPTPFYALVENEIVEVTSVTGMTWTITRGVAGSTSTAHANGASVGLIVTDITDNEPVPKSLYVAYNVNFVQPLPVGSPNYTTISQVVVQASADGGHSFSTVQRLNVGGAGESSPQILFTQASASGSANLVAGGQMDVFYDTGAGVALDMSQPDGGVASTPVTATQNFTQTPPLGGAQGPGSPNNIADASAVPISTTLNMPLTNGITATDTTLIVLSSAGFPVPVPPNAPFIIQIGTEDLLVTATSFFPSTTWTVIRGVMGTTAQAAPNGSVVSLPPAASTPVTTSFTQTVSLNASNLTAITDMAVTLDITDPHMDQLKAELIAPNGTVVDLFLNHVNSNDAVIVPLQGLLNAGTNLGVVSTGNLAIYNAIGTVFDDNADRSIKESGEYNPYVGEFRPEMGALSSFYNGVPIGQLDGIWTLSLTDYVNDGDPPQPVPDQNLIAWSLHFTGIIQSGGFSGIGAGGTTAATVGASPTNFYPLITVASGALLAGSGVTATNTPGVGPGVSVAQDETLGGFSPYQGRLYLVYTGGAGSDTNIFLIHSDDGGMIWSAPVQVNDDTPADNFSEGDRPMFNPEVAVDPVTGTVVVTWYDGRNDASESRVANSVAVSNDGGQTFSTNSYLNQLSSAINVLTSQNVDLGPLPGNQTAAGQFNVAGVATPLTYGFGDRSGLTAYDGRIVAVFSTNLNSAAQDIATALVTTAAGPRIIYGDMGPVTAAATDPATGSLIYNNNYASDGTRMLDGFVIQFDRPVAISSFTLADIQAQFQDPNSPAIITIPIGSVTPLDQGPYGEQQLGAGAPAASQLLATEFFVRFATPQSRVGTYSYAVGPTVEDMIRNATTLNEPAGIEPSAILAGGIGATDTTIDVAGASGFPVAGLPTTFVVQIDNEQMEVTNANGDVWTVVRGFNGTTPAPHADGANVLSATITVTDDIAYRISAPFIVQIDNEQLLVTGGTTTTTWNVVRGYNNTFAVAHANGAAVITLGNLMDQNANSVSGEQDTNQTTINTSSSIDQTGGIVDTTVNQGLGTTIDQVGGITAAATSMTVASNLNYPVAGLPEAPFVVQVGDEQMEVTGVRKTTINQALGITSAATTVKVTSSAGVPATPFVVQIDDEQIEVTAVAGTTWTIVRGVEGSTIAPHGDSTTIFIPTWTVVRGYNGTVAAGYANNTAVLNVAPTQNLDTTISQPGGVLAGDTTMNVASNASFPVAGLPGAPFVVQVDNEEMEVTSVLTTTINQVAAVTAGDTTITVASSAGFPLTPFVVQIGIEQVEVTNMAGTTWTVVRGFDGTTPAAYASGTTIYGPTWTIMRGVNGTTPAAHANGAAVLDTTLTVGSDAGFLPQLAGLPDTPFVVQVGAEQMQVTNAARTTIVQNADTTINQPGGVLAADTTMTVASSAGVPPTPFVMQIDDEEIQVTGVGATRINQAGGLSAGATALTVALSAGFPPTPFVIQVGAEQMEVTAVAGLNWTVVRGFNGTTATAQPNGAVVTSLTWTIVRGFNGTVAASHYDGANVLSTSLVVASSAGFPATPFVAQLGAEQVQVTNIQSTTLAASMLAGDTTMMVASSAGFPPSGTTVPFVVTVGNEQMEVTNIAGTTWTVVRGFNGTTPAAQASGATVLGTAWTIVRGFNATTPAVQSAGTNIFGLTWTVTRGFNGTSASPHVNGDGVLNATMTVSTNLGFPVAGLPATPFVVQVGSEQVQVTNVSTTTVSQPVAPSDTTITVAANTGFPPTPFVIQVGAEQMEVTSIPATLLSQASGLSATATTMTVATSAGFLPVPFLPASFTPFVVQIGSEQMQVTGVANTTIDEPGGIQATDTTLTVASSAGFPPTPFIIQVGAEQMQVTNITGTTWTVVRGVNGTAPAAQGDGTAILGPTWTVSRGYNSTTPAFHPNGANVVGTTWTVVRGINGTTALPQAVGAEVVGTNWTVVRGFNNTVATGHADGASILPVLDVSANVDQPGGIAGTTINKTGGITAASTTMTVASNANFPVAGLPGTPFVVQIDSEQIEVTGASGTTWTIVRGFNGTSAAPHGNGATVLTTTVTVTTNAGFPVAQLPGMPFFVQIDNEEMEVTGAVGTTWTVIRAVNGTAAAVHANGATVQELTPGGISATDTTMVVSNDIGYGLTAPFIVQIDNEEIEVVGTSTPFGGGYGTLWTILRGVNGTTPAAHADGARILILPEQATSSLASAIGVGVIQITVSSNTGFPTATTFTVQIDTEQMRVISVPATTLNQPGGLSASATTMTVAASGAFPATPFNVQIDDEDILVSNIVGTTWTIQRGVNGTLAAAHADLAAVTSLTWTVERTFNGTYADSHNAGVPVFSIDAPDLFSVPTPVQDVTQTQTAAGNYVPGVPQVVGAPFTLPYSTSTLPLSIPGPHVVSTTLPAEVSTTLSEPAGMAPTSTTMNVASNSGFPIATPFTPFVVQIDSELVQVNAVVGTIWTIVRGVNGSTPAAHVDGSIITYDGAYTPNATTYVANPSASVNIATVIAQSGGLAVDSTSTVVQSNSTFPNTPFLAQIDNEQVQVTRISNTATTITVAGGLSAGTTITGAMLDTDTTMTVAATSNFPVAGLPGAPFVVQIDNEQVLVTSAVGNIWTIERGYNGTTPAAHAGGAVVLNSTITVASSAGFPPTPFVVTIAANGVFPSEQLLVMNVAGTTWTVLRGIGGTTAGPHPNGTAIAGPSIWTLVRGVNGTVASAHADGASVLEVGGVAAGATSVTVASSAAFGPEPFDVQIENEQVTVTNAPETTLSQTGGIVSTTITQAGGILATDTTMVVASNSGFPIADLPGTPFVVQVGNEQVQVTGVVGTTWTIVRGFNGTIAAAHANGANVLNTTITVSSDASFPTAAGLPTTPFVVQVGSGRPQAVTPGTTTIIVPITAGATTLSVASSASFPITPFAIQIDNEQMLVTNVVQTTIGQVGGITATATTLSVASSAGFPATPFVVQIGNEQVRVTNVNGTSWTIVRGVNGTTAVAHANGATVLGTIWTVVRGYNGSTAAAHASGAAVLQNVAATTIEQYNGIAADSTTMTVASNAGFPIAQLPVTPFVVEIDDEQIEVTNVAATTLVGAVTSSATTLTVASSIGFPPTPFVIQAGNEEMLVANVVGTTWTVVRGYNGTIAAAQADGASIATTTWTIVRGFNGTAAAAHMNSSTVAQVDDEQMLVTNIPATVINQNGGITVGATTLNVASSAGLPPTPFVVQVGAEQMEVTNVPTTTVNQPSGIGAGTTINQVGGLTAGATSLTVVSDAQFPVEGLPGAPFVVQIGSEQMRVTNVLTTTLVGAITAAQTAITVNSSAGFPATPFQVQIGGEQMQVTAVAGNNWTVVRGFDGTSAVAQANGATIYGTTWTLVRGVNGTVAAIHANGAAVLNTTMTVSSSAGFPSTPFIASIGAELVQVTNITGTTWTMLRQVNGTTAATQPDGAIVASTLWTVVRGFNGTAAVAHLNGTTVISTTWTVVRGYNGTIGGAHLNGENVLDTNWTISATAATHADGSSVVASVLGASSLTTNVNMSGGLNASSTALTVASTANFPATPFVIQIDSEQIEVTTVTGNNWVIVRGWNSTTPAAHSDGELVTLISPVAAVVGNSTTLTVASNAGFPVTATPFVAQIDGESVEVTGVAGTTWTIVRGFNGTAVASHANAATIAYQPENVALNGTNNAIDIVFDRNIAPGTLTSANVQSVTGPIGPITGTTIDQAAGIIATDTTMNVASDIGFPPTPFVIQIEDEQILVTHVAGTLDTTWTLQRGFNGTTAVGHSNGVSVQLINLGTTLNVATTVAQPNGLVGTMINEPSGVAPNDTTITVASNAGFPVAGLPGTPFTIQVDSEEMRVVSAAGGTWSVVRGINGTSAVAHANFATVIWIEPLVVSSNTGFPVAGLPATPFYIQIDNEQMEVVGAAGTSWTVVRGVNGTAVATHAFGAEVLQLNPGGIAAGDTTMSVASDIGFPITSPFTPFNALIDSEEVRVANIATTTINQAGGIASGTTINQAGGISFFATTMTVASNAGFPAATPFIVQVDSELMQVTAVAGTTWTVVRGFDNTAAVTHANAANVLPATVTVTSSAAFPAAPFIVQVGGEQMLVISVASTTWTVVRGINNTTPEAQLNGAIVASLAWTIGRGINNTTPATHAIGASVLPLNGIYTVIQDPPGTPAALALRTFRIIFPAQTLSGAYNAVVSPVNSAGTGVADTTPQANGIDTNSNAGLDVTRGNANPSVAPIKTTVYQNTPSPATVIPAFGSVSSTISVTDAYQILQSTTQRQFDGATTALNGGITFSATTLNVQNNAGFPITSTPFVVLIDAEQIQVTNVNGLSWTVVRGFNGSTPAAHLDATIVTLGLPDTIEVELNIAQQNIQNLSATLTSPTGTVVNLFYNVGQFGHASFANFANTVFDDSAGNASGSAAIESVGSAPTVGPYNPETPLSVLDGEGSLGNWTLTITNNGPNAGTLTQWQLRLPHAVPTNGMDEPVADDFSVSFNIFTQDVANAQSSTQWTAIGPQGNTNGPTFGSNAGPVTAVAVDPSDPSGNTVYAGSASGGIWMTTDFLTTNPAGPTWVPLTDFGPTESLYIGSIAVFARNDDPSQTVIIAATGNANPYVTLTSVDMPNAGFPANSMSATSTVIGVASSLGAPVTPFVAEIGGELVEVTNVNPITNTWTIVRGWLGTAPAAHLDGTAIDLNETVNSATAAGPDSPNTMNFTGSPGIGFLRSTDGGKTWEVLDSTDNVDPVTGNVVPMNSTVRDHAFDNTVGYQVAIDPTPLPNGNIIVYAALSGTNGSINGGVYRSLDGGSTWTLLQAGNATSVVLAPASRDANGNETVLYAAFNGDGVYTAVGPAYAAVAMTQLVGGNQPSTPRVDVGGSLEIPIGAPADNPNNPPGGATSKGNIILAVPSITNNPLADTFYQGWVYAATADTNGNFDGLYLSKDFGLNWTELNLPAFFINGTNNETRPNYSPSAGIGFNTQATANYALSLTVDPSNPEVVYLGGGSADPMIRIDTSMMDDPYALTPSAETSVVGGIGAVNSGQITNPYGPGFPNNGTGDYTNLYRVPQNPFVAPSSLQFTGVASFPNTGTDVRWGPLNAPGLLEDTTNIHTIVAVPDSLTGGTRLIIGDDQGVYTGVLSSTGAFVQSEGSATIVSGSRNGDLQIAEMYDSASQPSAAAASVAGALYYASAFGNGYPQSSSNILSTGDLIWTGSDGGVAVNDQNGTFVQPVGSVNASNLPDGQVMMTPGVATDQTGSGQAYQDVFPSTIPNPPLVPTDFFEVTPPGSLPQTRVSGLVQNAPATNPSDIPGENQGQWPYFEGSIFAVNPYDPTAIVISSQAGRLFLSAGASTGGTGVTWKVIANPADLDGSPVTALAFGAQPQGSNTPDNFIYAGTQDGNVYVTYTGGGFNGSTNWRLIGGPAYVNGPNGIANNGLDGSPIMQIVPDTKAGSRDVYVATSTGVFYLADAGVGGTATTIRETGGITAAATTMTVASSTGFPAVPFVIQIGTELMQVTNITGTTWTIARGFDGTTAVAHVNGAPITSTDPYTQWDRISDLTTLNAPLDTSLASGTIKQAGGILPDGATTTISQGGGLGGLAGNTTLNVASDTGFPATPFVVQIDAEQIEVTSAPETTISQAGGIGPTDTTMTVASSAAFPATPFVVQVDAEQMLVTNINGTTWTIVRGVNNTNAAAHAIGADIVGSWTIVRGFNGTAVAAHGNGAQITQLTTMNVNQTSAANFPTTPFIASIGGAVGAPGTELIEVLNITGTTWTVLRGVNGTTPTAFVDGTPIYEATDLLFGVSRPNQNLSSDQVPALAYLTSIQADWRYGITSADGPSVTTSINTAGGITAVAGTITVASNTSNTPNPGTDPPVYPNFPTAPFVIEVDQEQMLVTAVNGTTWTVVRGYNGTWVSAHANGANVTLLTEPALYVAGNGGVFQSIDQGLTWNLYPTITTTLNQAANVLPTDTTMTVSSNAGFPTTVPFVVQIDSELIEVTNVAGTTWTIVRGVGGTQAALHAERAAITYVDAYPPDAPVANGYLPNANVTSLSLVLGNFNPTIGFYDTSSGLDQLVVSTYGRGDYAIRLNDSDISRYQVSPLYGPVVSTVVPNLNALQSQFSGYTVTFNGPVDAASFTTSDAVVYDLPETTINETGGITAAATSLTVTSSVGFPAAPFVALIGGEQIEVTNVTGNTWTIVRGFNGTTAAAHANGSVVQYDSTTNISMPPQGITAGATTMTVASNLGFPVAGLPATPFYVTVGNELMEVTGVAGTTWTVIRGVDGTTASAHANGATVASVFPVPVATVVDVSGNSLHNVYQITFVTPQTNAGFYTLAIGPNIYDLGGDPMLTSPLPYLFYYSFFPAAPPVATSIADQMMLLGGYTGPIPFSIGDPRTPSGPFTVTGSSSNNGVVTGIAFTGGTSASQTINVGPGLAYGTSTITITVSDNLGLQSTETFMVTVDAPPSFSTPIGNITVPHGTGIAPNVPSPYTLPINAVNNNPSTTLTFGATVVDPLAALETKYGLQLEDGFFNYRHENEKYLLSDNGSNAAGGGWYVLMPTGNLYAWNGALSSTLGTVPVATLAPSVYYNPALLTTNSGIPMVTAGTNPFYDLKIQYGLVNPVNTATKNTHGANEEYLQSSNGSNSLNGGYYVLMPNDELYYWDSGSTITGGSLASLQLVADFTQAPYAAAVPAISTTITGNLTANATTMTVASSAGFASEPLPFAVLVDSELIQVTNISGANWTITRGYDGTTAAAHANGSTAAFGDVYANPFLLTSAVLPTAIGVTVSAAAPPDGGTLTINLLPGFDRSVNITATANDSFFTSSETFTFTVTNVAPSISPIGNVTINHNAPTPTTVGPLTVTDPDPDSTLRTFSVAVSGYSPLYDLQQQYGLVTANNPALNNANGHQEIYLQSSNGSNASATGNIKAGTPGAGYYVLVNDALYAWTTNIGTTLTPAHLVANFAAAPYANLGNVYNNPALLYNALPPASPTVASNRGPLYDIQTQLGLTTPVKPAQTNNRGSDEKYLLSTNGSNPAGSNYYVLMPNDELYAYVPDAKNDLVATLANAPVVNFTQAQYAAAGNIWATPSLLTSAQPAFNNDPNYNVKQVYGLTTADQTQYFNYRGQNEKYLQSTNGSNAANGGWYVLMPTGLLYTYVKDAQNNLTSTVVPANLVYAFSPSVYANPALLYADSGQVPAVTATISPSGVISLTPNVAFTGTVRITATVSDGAEFGKQSFLFTVNDTAPTLNPISAASALSSAGSTTIPYTAATFNGAPVLPAATVAGYNPLYNTQQQYGLTAAPFKTSKTALYFKSSNGSNPANGNEYVLSSSDVLYQWTGSISSSETAANQVANFGSSAYTQYDGNANIFASPILFYAAPPPAPAAIVTDVSTPGSLKLSWTPGLKGTFVVTLFVGDGAQETQQSFMLTLS